MNGPAAPIHSAAYPSGCQPGTTGWIPRVFAPQGSRPGSPADGMSSRCRHVRPRRSGYSQPVKNEELGLELLVLDEEGPIEPSGPVGRMSPQAAAEVLAVFDDELAVLKTRRRVSEQRAAEVPATLDTPAVLAHRLRVFGAADAAAKLGDAIEDLRPLRDLVAGALAEYCDGNEPGARR
uniref:hypothetical protein n=1 Tax=Amycolatopsis sp. CA-096443 TaxID=3239919 RepID=UPI003F49517A